MNRSEIIWTPDQEKALAFEANLCLIAGAGSGKTMTLVELVLRLLQGRVAGIEAGLDLSGILALTYTEKAAREMRDRLRRAINEEIFKGPLNHRDFWIRQRRLLDRAHISTIHGFCFHLLRRYGLAAGLDPDLAVLEDSRDLEAEIFRDRLVDLIQDENPDLLAFLEYYPWQVRGYGQGLDGLLTSLIRHSRTFGRRAHPAGGETGGLDRHIQKLRQAVLSIHQLDEAGSLNRQAGYYQCIRGFSEAVHKALDLDQESLLTALPAIKVHLKGHWQKARPAKELAEEAVEALEGELARRTAGPLQDKLLDLAGRLEAAMIQAKEGRRVVDFDDLLLLTRTLLVRNLQVRTELKKRFRVVLVDEFQDTNRLQADILAFLLEPEDQNKALDPEFSPLELLDRAPRRLIVFGDPKQSIYRFRGAEVSVFQRLKKSLGREADGRVISLKKNFRSQKRLVEFFNAFFPLIMPGGADFAAAYGEEDYQDPVRPDLADGPAVEILLLENGQGEAETRRREARVLAGWIADILDRRRDILVGREARRPEPRDIAILLRRFTHVQSYEEALRQAGLPYYVVRGRGFYQCPEVRDLINLLIYLANPAEGPALLGVLRSPLLGLTDSTITRLAWPVRGESRCNLADYFGPNPPVWPKGLSADQIETLEKTREVLTGLNREAGRAFSEELIEAAIEKTDYLAVLSAQPQGEQKVANVQRFIEVARGLPHEALYAPGEMAGFLKARLIDPGDDPEAQTTGEGGAAVQLMTIHQAKGLEFPIVVVPDAGHRPKAPPTRLLFDQDDRFSLSFNDPETGDARNTPEFRDIKRQEAEREEAEYLRLLYVAATRAQDHLVFSGNIKSKNDQTSWLAALEDFARSHPKSARLIEEDLNRPRPTPRPGAEPDFSDLPAPGPIARSIISRVLERTPLRPKTLTLDVTGLGHYLLCPRRFYLEEVLGLPGEWGTPATRERNPGLDPRQKGVVFHYLMETVDLDSPPALEDLAATALEKIRIEGWPASPEEGLNLARQVQWFLGSPWGRDLLRSGSGLVWRESPLSLRIDPGQEESPALILNGVIDLFYVTPDGQARLVDYKYAFQAESWRYQAQLRTYALALLKAGLAGPLEVGLYFTHESQSQVIEIKLEPGWDHEHFQTLRRAASDLGRIMGPEETVPVRPPVCPDPDCGLKYACR